MESKILQDMSNLLEQFAEPIPHTEIKVGDMGKFKAWLEDKGVNASVGAPLEQDLSPQVSVASIPLFGVPIKQSPIVPEHLALLYDGDNVHIINLNAEKERDNV